jgi:hypothetical protein
MELEIVGDFGMWLEIMIIKWSWRLLEILECGVRS